MTHEQLLDRICDKQKALMFNDSQFSKHIGVSRNTWVQIKLGYRKVGLTLIRALSRSCPEFDPLILKFLKEDHNGQ